MSLAAPTCQGQCSVHPELNLGLGLKPRTESHVTNSSFTEGSRPKHSATIMVVGCLDCWIGWGANEVALPRLAIKGAHQG